MKLQGSDSTNERNGSMATIAKPENAAFIVKPEKAALFLNEKSASQKTLERFFAHKPNEGVKTPFKKG